VKITIRNLQKSFPVSRKRIKGLILKTLSCEARNKKGIAEIAVFLVSDREIARINRLYLGRKSPTDVIAFDLSGPDNRLFADIVVSTQRARANAKRFATSAMFEIELYVVHGLLHILGYNDRNKKEACLMQSKAENIILCPSKKRKP